MDRKLMIPVLLALFLGGAAVGQLVQLKLQHPDDAVPRVDHTRPVDWSEAESLADLRRDEQARTETFLSAPRQPVVIYSEPHESWDDVSGDEDPRLALAQARVAELTEENDRLRLELHALRVSEALQRVEGATGPIGEWARDVPVDVLPSLDTLVLAAEYLTDYPVRLAHHEGLWLFERMERDDWLEWGETIDEAIIQYLGPERLRRELTPEALKVLQAAWSEEGYFQ